MAFEHKGFWQCMDTRRDKDYLEDCIDQKRSMGQLDNNKIIRLSKSCLGQLEKNYVMQVLENEFLGMGEVKKFENELKSFSRPVVCVNSGTAALQLALQAIGVSTGDEVLVQSLTYVAFSSNNCLWGKPIACDVCKETLCIDLNDAKRKISSKTKP